MVGKARRAAVEAYVQTATAALGLSGWDIRLVWDAPACDDALADVTPWPSSRRVDMRL